MYCTAGLGWRCGILLSPGIGSPPSSQHFCHFNETAFEHISHFKTPWAALGPTQPHIQWVPRLSPLGKRPGRGVNPYPPSSAMFESGWCYTSTPQICRHGGDKENFIFLLYSCSSRQEIPRRFGPQDWKIHFFHDGSHGTQTWTRFRQATIEVTLRTPWKHTITGHCIRYLMGHYHWEYACGISGPKSTRPLSLA